MDIKPFGNLWGFLLGSFVQYPELTIFPNSFLIDFKWFPKKLLG